MTNLNLDIQHTNDTLDSLNNQPDWRYINLSQHNTSLGSQNGPAPGHTHGAKLRWPAVNNKIGVMDDGMRRVILKIPNRFNWLLVAKFNINRDLRA